MRYRINQLKSKHSLMMSNNASTFFSDQTLVVRTTLVHTTYVLILLLVWSACLKGCFGMWNLWSKCQTFWHKQVETSLIDPRTTKRWEVDQLMLYPQTFLSQNISHTPLITTLAYPFRDRTTRYTEKRNMYSWNRYIPCVESGPKKIMLVS